VTDRVSALDGGACRHTALPLTALALSAMCWGTALVMTKAAVLELPPFTVFFVQLGTSVCFLWMCLALRQRPVRITRGAIRGSLAGLLEPGVAYAACVWGLTRTSASSASVILASEPIFIVLLAWLLHADRPSARTIILLLAGLAGVVMVSVTARTVTTGHVLGNVLVAMGTVSAALYVVLSSRSVIVVESLTLVAFQQTIGLLFALGLLAGALALGSETWPKDLSPSTLLICMFSGVVQYALAFWLYLYGLKYVPVSTAAIFLTLIPVFAIGTSALFLGETLDTWQWSGCVIVMVTAILISRRRPVTAR
jgi:drug/metabolite transporter (DMT)-like permease